MPIRLTQVGSLGTVQADGGFQQCAKDRPPGWKRNLARDLYKNIRAHLNPARSIWPVLTG